ncbi:PucR family transcriptional regulator [Rhodococcus gordoniae]|uniref:PucR family transcriptional regulator n=1 Tax=Rhodococcus gordoniae TaxID=223392 RepID=UPI0020CE96AC|nr:PucR family transcriptional regulator [Rhodococcus gordoniae]UTT50910.1 PucR family transcriptional regulator [Rhodococcus gordoniae]
MSIGIGWLLSQSHLGLKVRAGRVNDERRISFVQPTELLDPTPWLSENALVLTTGLGLTAADCAEYVRRLVDAGASAIGFGTGLSHDRIPSEMLDEADRWGLPVLEVPYTTPFAAITRSVSERLTEQQYESVRRAASAQVRITRAALRGGTPAIVRELATAVGASVAFVDERSGAVAAHPKSATALAGLARTIPKAGAGSTTVSEPGISTTVQPVMQSGNTLGYVVVQVTHPLEAVDMVLVGHAVSLVTLDLDKPQRLRRERNALGGRVLQLSLEGLLPADKALTHLGDACGEDGLIRILHIEGKAPAAVARELETAFAARRRPFYTCERSGSVLVLLRGDDSGADVEDMLRRIGSGRGSSAGLSAPHHFGQVEHAATQAVLATSKIAGSRRVREFDPRHGTALLTSPDAVAVLRSVATSTVSVLAAYDRDHDTCLVESLRAFLESNGQWESAASVLDVHRHTLRARVAKAGELMDVDMTDARVRAELLLGILAGVPG